MSHLVPWICNMAPFVYKHFHTVSAAPRNMNATCLWEQSAHCENKALTVDRVLRI